MNPIRSPGKLWWASALLRQRLLRHDPVSRARIHPAPLVTVGRGSGAWVVPAAALSNPQAIVYAVGVGENTDFDEALAGDHHLTVHAFDPTPRAIAHAAKVSARLPRFRFQPLGLWNEDADLTFHAPANPSHVSHSLTGLQGHRPSFTAPCRRLTTLMRDLGHNRVDLLKIDIEGAEYAVLRDILRAAVPVGALCVEFDETHSPQDAGWRDRIAAMVAELEAGGYRLVAVRPKGNYTFLGTTAR